MTFALLLLPVAWGEATCTFLQDGNPTERLVCGDGGTWTVACPAPPAQGKIRATFVLPARGLSGEARVNRGTSGPLELNVSGPGGRPSAFLVAKAAAGLLPGQAIGPLQLCPSVQPDVPAGAAPPELPVEVVVSVHRIEGYDPVQLDGGVMGSAPRYDAGTVHARGRAVVVQREKPLIPILVGADAIALDDLIRGTVSVRVDERWANVGYSGFRRPVALAAAHVDVLVIDFVAMEVEEAFGTDPVEALRDDLDRWLAGAMTTLSPTVWVRAEAETPPAVGAWSAPRGAMGWRVAEAEKLQVRVGRAGLRVRAVVARSTAPLDAEARQAIDSASKP